MVLNNLNSFNTHYPDTINSDEGGKKTPLNVRINGIDRYEITTSTSVEAFLLYFCLDAE